MQLNSFPAFLVFAIIIHAFIRKSNDVSHLSAFEEFLVNIGFLKIVKVHKNVASVLVHDDKPVVFVFIEELQSATESLCALLTHVADIAHLLHLLHLHRRHHGVGLFEGNEAPIAL